MSRKPDQVLFDQSLADAIPDAVLVVGSDGVIRFHNREAHSLFRVPAGRCLIGEPIELLVPNELRSRHVDVREAYDAAPRRRPMRPEFTVQARRLDGSAFPCEVSLSPSDVDGRQVTFCVVRDVSDRLETRELLSAERRRLAAIVEFTTLGIAELRADGSRVTANAELGRLLERDPSAMSLTDWYDLVDEEDRAELVHRALDARSQHRGFAAEFRVGDRHPVKWLRVHADPLVGALGEVTGWLAIFENITERKLAESMLVRQARYDPLTGLPNHVSLVQCLSDHLERGRSAEGQVGVLCVDVDRFTSVNDELGRDRGDALLVEIARRIQHCLRPGDVVGRVTGDEFVVVCGGLGGTADARDIADRVIACFDRPFAVDGLDVAVTASVGVAVGGDGTPESVLRDASAAADAAKLLGGGTVRLFDAGMAEKRSRRRLVERLLRDAASDVGIRIAYQPVVNVVTGKVVAIEALARFPATSIGTGELIEVAEDTGLIVPVGRQVVARALREFVAAGLDEDVRLHVNLSPRQLADPMFVMTLLAATESLSLGPHRITLEITETAAAPLGSRSVLAHLTGLGFQLAVDDFGMGHASLTVLQHLPVEAVKIDRSFVGAVTQRPRGEEIVATIIRVAETLDLSVIAEGVETAAQRDALLALGCDLMQGFHFARPVPIGELRTRLDALAASLVTPSRSRSGSLPPCEAADRCVPAGDPRDRDERAARSSAVSRGST